MRYAVIPHSGDWREAGVFRDGLELNHPLIVRKVVAHAGKLPARWGFVSVSSPQVVMSALNPAINGRTILRVYEATGNPAPNVHVRFTAGVSSAHEADLLERPSRDLTVNGGDVLLDLGPFEVKTLAFELGASTKPK